jgi:uncharacterized membrane protein
MWKKLLLGFVLFLFVLSLSVNLVAFDLDFYESEQVDIEEVKVLRGYFMFQDVELDGYDAEELQHLKDVRLLFVLNLVLSLVLFIVVVFFLRSFLYSGLVSLGLVLLLLPFSLVFHWVFIKFHEVLFWNEAWMLDPGAKLLKLFSESFFFDAYLQLILYSVMFSLFVVVMGVYKK